MADFKLKPVHVRVSFCVYVHSGLITRRLIIAQMQPDVFCLFFTPLWYLSFNVQNYVLKAYEKLTLNLNSRHGATRIICDITASIEPIIVQYSTYTGVIWKLESSSAQTLGMDLTVKKETSCVQQWNSCFAFILESNWQRCRQGARRERGMTCIGLWLESNQGHCDYVACSNHWTTRVLPAVKLLIWTVFT